MIINPNYSSMIFFFLTFLYYNNFSVCWFGYDFEDTMQFNVLHTAEILG